MEVHVKAINSLVSPAEAACELGLHPRIKDNACIVSCPNCDKPMFVLDTGFVCSSHSCNFKAGGVIDMISLTEKISIGKACDYFFEAFAVKTKKISRYNDAEFISELALRLRYKRKLLEFFLRRRNNEPDRAYAIQALGALRKAGITLQDNKLTGFVLTAEDVSELNSILAHFNTCMPNIPAATAALVIPYFSDHHTIDSLTVSTPASPAKDHKIIDIERNARLTWAGLLQTHPAVDKVELTESAMDMLIANTAYARTGTGKEIALHCRYRGTVADVLWKPLTCKYIVTDDSSTSPVIALSKLDSCLTDMTLSVRGVERPVRDYILDECFEALLEDGLSPSAKLMLEASQLDEKERRDILVRLHDARAYDAAESVRKFLRVVLVHKDDRSLLYSTPDGYLVAKDESAEKLPVTNFVLDILHNIVFPDSQDVFHVADLTINANKRRIVLKPTDIDRISDLETAVRFASGGDNETLDDKLPTVRDKGCGRIMSSYLRYKISEVPRLEGIPFLGWNDQKTRFYGPYWYADKRAGCIPFEAELHPFKQDMQYFSNVPFSARSLHTDIPSCAATVIAQYASMLVRSYLGYAGNSVHYVNNDKHSNLLHAVFGALGQHCGMPACNVRNYIGAAHSANVNTFSGLPRLVITPQATEADNKRTRSKPGGFEFCLGAQGCIFEDIEQVEIREDDIKSCAAHVVFAVLDWILRTEAKAFKPASSVSFAQCAAAEGNDIIAAACGLSSWNQRLSEYTTLEAFLADVRYEEVNRYVHYNVNEHIVTLDLTSRPDLSIEAIAQELEKLGANKISVNSNKITTDSGSMMTALESYYHNRPEVEESFDAAALLSDM